MIFRRVFTGKSIDLTREEFPEEKFDVALDKACLDSIVCSPHGAKNVENYLQQMDRCVSTNVARFGEYHTYVLLSQKQPQDNMIASTGYSM